MKTQALAFFTMLSLILMLSIYYITIPKETTTTMKEESVISTIEEDKNNKKTQNMEDNESVLSDANASIEEKENAIIENEKVKDTIKLEETLSEKVFEKGYKNEIEIIENTIHVSLFMENDSNIASTVMKLLYKEVQNKYLIEIQFLSE